MGLALQGGGAIGAFTWGALDALLEDGRVSFEAISGTSAGALNAVVLADGLARGGPDEARAGLHRLWEGISLQSAAVAAVDESIDSLFRFWRAPGASLYQALLKLSPAFSPYNFNPFNLNPLVGLIDRLVDFERLRHASAPQIFVSSTHVETGENRVFTGAELSAETVMASAALPFMFQAVTVDGEAYWDGGYTGNPALWPFVTATGIRDVLIVQLEPMMRKEVPRTARDVLTRIRELTYNISLIHELRALELLDQLALSHGRRRGAPHNLRLHRIDATHALLDDQSHRGLDLSWRFMEELFAVGREVAKTWLARGLGGVGRSRPETARTVVAASPPPRRAKAGGRPFSLALQGGGGHGAFTWGVLDRLLETGALEIEAITGASGGATNAVVLADALAGGDPERGREQLHLFWRHFAQAVEGLAAGNPFLRALHRQWQHWGSLQTGLITGAADSVTTLPANPLRTILESMIDFDRLQRASPIALFIGATDVRTGQSRIFSGRDIDAAAVAASACLPFAFAAIEIDGAAYWDGGYSDNPPLRPLLGPKQAANILLVHVYPRRRDVAKTPEQIFERITEITFNNSILQELHAVDQVGRLIAEGRLDGHTGHRHRIHRIHPASAPIDREARSKTDLWPFFLSLRDAGRDVASAWLAREGLGPAGSGAGRDAVASR